MATAKMVWNCDSIAGSKCAQPGSSPKSVGPCLKFWTALACHRAVWIVGVTCDDVGTTLKEPPRKEGLRSLKLFWAFTSTSWSLAFCAIGDFQAPQGIAQSILKDLRQEDHEWNQDERFMPRDLKSETALHQQDGNYSTESWIAHRVSRLSQELAAVVGFPATARKHVQAAVHEANPQKHVPKYANQNWNQNLPVLLMVVHEKQRKTHCFCRWM